MTNLRWKVITILAVLVVFAAVGVYPIVAARYGITSPAWLMDKKLKLGLDLKGGVHLVLRVQTDDALRLETETAMERLRETLTHGRHHRRPTSRAPSPTAVPRRRHPAGPGRGVPAGGRPRSRPNFDRSSGAGGSYTFTMRPNVQATLREEAVAQARQTIERRVNELGVAEPSVAQQGSAAIRSWCSCPASPTSQRAKEIIRSTGAARAEARRAGAVGDARSAAGQRPGARRAWRSCPAPAARRATPAAHGLLPGAQGGRGHRPRPAQRAADARREQPAGGQLHAEHRGRRASSATSPARTSAASSRSSSTTACSRRRRIEGADHRPTGGSPAASRRRKCRTCR